MYTVMLSVNSFSARGKIAWMNKLGNRLLDDSAEEKKKEHKAKKNDVVIF